ncbi:MAG TPA: CHASE domain-containing protein [Burkholderiaceae bacterium]|jgi:PAS domain S-box-containing protein
MRLTRKLARYLIQSLLLALAYLALALAGLQLAADPQWVSVLFPAAGLSLAAVSVLGWRYVPAIAVGAFLTALITVSGDGRAGLIPVALGISLGTGLQAFVGAWLVRRFVSRPLMLCEPGDVIRFAGLGALSCVVSASISLGSLWLSGRVSSFATAWLAWWVGDTIGVLIAAPMVLALIGRPRRVWRSRRLSVGLPLLFVSALMGLATHEVAGWDHQRAMDAFERDALTVSNAVQLRTREPLLALEAVRSMVLVSPNLSRQDFELGTEPYLPEGGPMIALGLARQVPPAQIPEIEKAARAEGLTDFHVHNRNRPGDGKRPPGEPPIFVRLIEPLPVNASVLGVNSGAVLNARQAIDRTRASGQPSASAGFTLTQQPEKGLGVVVYAALYDGRPQTPEARDAAFRGAVFATLRPAALLAEGVPSLPDYLRLCLVDLAPHPAQRLAGEPDCERLAGLPTQEHVIQFGDRQWALRVYAPNGLPPRDPVSVPFAVLGAVAVGLLAMFLLLVSGRTQRIEEQVRSRTAQLQREIAEREEATHALVASEQRLRDIFDSTPIGIVFTSIEGVFKAVNPHFCAMLGRSEDELLEHHVADFTVPEDRGSFLRQRQQIERGEIQGFVAGRRFLRADGSVLHTRVKVRLMRDEGSGPPRLVSAVQDIGDEFKMRDLEQARQTAEAANRAKTEFLSRMSHELRTPLNAMLGFTQLLEMDPSESLSARQRSRTIQIQQAGWHLLEMINDTLDLSRIEAGALRLEPTMLDLGALLNEAQALIEADAAARQLVIRTELDRRASQAFGDATRVKQIVTNLLSNAVKYNRHAGAITIRTEAPDPNWVEISVADTGMGLSAGQLANLYQPFNRLGREHGGPAGTGIGLVICKRLAELMGGGLSATSIEGSGSTFVLRLPANGEVEATHDTDAMAPSPVVQGTRRVVYIEDNEMNIAVMRGILEQRPQLELTVYLTGQTGLNAVQAEPPDLLLLDMQLPDVNGLEILRRLRQRWNDQQLPVIAVSANALPEQITACKALGVRDYLTKPVDLREILTLLDKVLA